MVHRAADIDLPTRMRLLGRLRLVPGTVAELAAEFGLTPNGIRAGLASLERDGLIRRAGVRRDPGAGKPPQLYAATAKAEEQFSTAYPTVLAAVASSMMRAMSADQVDAVMSDAGRSLGASSQSSPVDAPSAVAAALLESLGAAVVVDKSGSAITVTGAACPLSVAVRECPATCELVRAMLAEATRTPVHMACEHGSAPRCRFVMVG